MFQAFASITISEPNNGSPHKRTTCRLKLFPCRAFLSTSTLTLATWNGVESLITLTTTSYYVSLCDWQIRILPRSFLSCPLFILDKSLGSCWDSDYQQSWQIPLWRGWESVLCQGALLGRRRVERIDLVVILTGTWAGIRVCRIKSRV